MATRRKSRRAKVTVREVGRGVYHVHENPTVNTPARRRFDAALREDSSKETAKAEDSTAASTR